VAAYGKLPLSFEINQVQTESRVKFLSRGSGYSLFLTGDEAVLVCGKAIPHQRVQVRKEVTGCQLPSCKEQCSRRPRAGQHPAPITKAVLA
jgi:hypothetical protein